VSFLHSATAASRFWAAAFARLVELAKLARPSPVRRPLAPRPSPARRRSSASSSSFLSPPRIAPLRGHGAQQQHHSQPAFSFARPALAASHLGLPPRLLVPVSHLAQHGRPAGRGLHPPLDPREEQAEARQGRVRPSPLLSLEPAASTKLTHPPPPRAQPHPSRPAARPPREPRDRIAHGAVRGAREAARGGARRGRPAQGLGGRDGRQEGGQGGAEGARCTQ